MTHFDFSEIERKRVNKWMLSAKPIQKQPQWTERRLAIDFGGHTYIVSNGQIFQCAHCGHYDPEWSVSGVLAFFESSFGIKPYEIDVTCSVAKKED